jgi:hypothetical protein
MAFLQTRVAEFAAWTYSPKKEDTKIGKYQIDYSEPTQEQIDAANAECADLFKSGEWISVNRKSCYCPFMGLEFYPLTTLPQQYDIVWCLYPESGLTPGPVARPSLVLDVRVDKERQIGAVVCTYGTGNFDHTHFNSDLIILGTEYKASGQSTKPLGFISRRDLRFRSRVACCCHGALSTLSPLGT